jgi:hypothetical protein
MQPQTVPQAKKSNVWVWVVAGCVGIVVLGGVVVGGVVWWGARKVKSVAEHYEKNPQMAAAQMIVAMNPDVELVSTDEAAGTMTVREKKTGKVTTIGINDAKEGRWNVTTTDAQGQKSSVSYDAKAGQVVATGPDGNSTTTFGSTSKVPDWIPAYPGAAAEGVYAAQTDDQNTGSFSATSDDGVDKVFSFYKDQLAAAGFKVTENRYSGSGGDGGMVAGESTDGKRTVSVILAAEDGKTKVTGTYSEKKTG